MLETENKVFLNTIQLLNTRQQSNSYEQPFIKNTIGIEDPRHLRQPLRVQAEAEMD